MTVSEPLISARDSVPPGRWGLALSGGADSVALFHLMRSRSDLQIIAIHLDHETREGQSTRDAAFVAELCASHYVPLESARRSQIEPSVSDLPANVQARFRALRLELFARTATRRSLQGVLQAHHADDQAETVLMRLIRGTGIEGLAGIPASTTVAGLPIVRPLLDVRRSDLRRFLVEGNYTWREDQSNASTKYFRNRVRQLLANRPALVEGLLRVQKAFAALSDRLDRGCPTFTRDISLVQARALPPLIQLHALRRWLLEQGSPADELTLQHLEGLREMIEDMGTAPAICLPGNVEVRRRAGNLSALGSV